MRGGLRRKSAAGLGMRAADCLYRNGEGDEESAVSICLPCSELLVGSQGVPAGVGTWGKAMSCVCVWGGWFGGEYLCNPLEMAVGGRLQWVLSCRAEHETGDLNLEEQKCRSASQLASLARVAHVLTESA